MLVNLRGMFNRKEEDLVSDHVVGRLSYFYMRTDTCNVGSNGQGQVYRHSQVLYRHCSTQHRYRYCSFDDAYTIYVEATDLYLQETCCDFRFCTRWIVGIDEQISVSLLTDGLALLLSLSFGSPSC